ncbi:hypothetical protein SKAU_G00008140 [Synaphobranchus kaupii]|uniref:TNFR-Cys domain-containing protein n=1 Tax=Synaphobranchus kaupii TaxID=118154 RepID=A0A9Q1JAY0_SYNKA|nr:hypothetical protein SKAU_G00008140 [Synaphobranchus kaupii]
MGKASSPQPNTVKGMEQFQRYVVNEVLQNRRGSILWKYAMRQHWNNFQFRMTILQSVLFFICSFTLVVAVNSSVGNPSSIDRNRLTREISCRENLEYPHKSFCCLNCPAGQYVKKACEGAGEMGRCERCEYGTFTEHSNGLVQCLPCTKCRGDQEITESCTSTKDTECQCKAHRFCVPEQACEVCKKCTKCKVDEEVVKNCTTTSNSACKKKPPSTDPISGSASTVAAAVTVPLLLGLFFIAFCCWKKRSLNKTTVICSNLGEDVKINVDDGCERTMEEKQNTLNAGLDEPEQEVQPFLQEITLVGAKPPQHEEEDRGLGDSLPSTTNSSQTSLSPRLTALSSNSPHPSPKTQRQPREHCRRLIPVNGEESLMKAFDIIENHLASNCRKKFFRKIGLSTNVIEDADWIFHAVLKQTNRTEAGL